jgi:hypothetical protein
VAGDWRRLHNEEHHNLYASPIIRVFKSRRMRWDGHAAYEMRNAYKIFGCKKLKGRDNFEDLCLDEMIILESFF